MKIHSARFGLKGRISVKDSKERKSVRKLSGLSRVLLEQLSRVLLAQLSRVLLAQHSRVLLAQNFRLSKEETLEI